MSDDVPPLDEGPLAPLHRRQVAQEELERKLEEQARTLGGGWRIEHGLRPIIILHTDEAQRIIDRLNETSMSYDSRPDTYEHIKTVRGYLMDVIHNLVQRCHNHDKSKLEEPELSVFDAVTPKLKELTYGSLEYNGMLAEMGGALQHHYQVNDHHPEHFVHGIADMDLIQMTEMLCDWKAATLRHDDGDLSKSITQNRERFGYGDETERLLRNTARTMGWL